MNVTLREKSDSCSPTSMLTYPFQTCVYNSCDQRCHRLRSKPKVISNELSASIIENKSRDRDFACWCTAWLFSHVKITVLFLLTVRTLVHVLSGASIRSQLNNTPLNKYNTVGTSLALAEDDQLTWTDNDLLLLKFTQWILLKMIFINTDVGRALSAGKQPNSKL